MKMNAPLNEVQRQLVADNIDVVHKAIRSSIKVNNTIYGFEYDDIFQEGCIHLCRAAVKYVPRKDVQFSTFAQTVVTNGLRTYCKRHCDKQKNFVPVPIFADADEGQLTIEIFSVPDQTEDLVSLIDTMNFLDSLKNQYTGVVRRGIEALEWKVKGYSGAEIADIYGVKPNLVGAWISKAVRKLEKNRMFIIWRDNLVVENKLT